MLMYWEKNVSGTGALTAFTFQSHFFVICLVALAVLSWMPASPCYAAGPAVIFDVLRESDAFFNSGDYRRALSGYEHVLQHAQLNADRDLEGEALNNIAAVHLVMGDASLFNSFFERARKVRQSQFVSSGMRPGRDAQANMLVNGGFERGIRFPWGTGHYERPREGRMFGFGLWWNSSGARAFMKSDCNVQKTGKRSLRITNFSPAKPHVFTTLSQRIENLRPNTVYRVSLYARTENLADGAVTFTIDAAWTKHVLGIPGGTRGWTQYSRTINIGHNDYIDFRVIHQNTGTVWLDDIVVTEVSDDTEKDVIQHVESLFDRADYSRALDVIKRSYQDNGEEAPPQLRLISARIYHIQGRYNTALAVLAKLVEENFSAALIDMGDLHFTLADYERAARSYEKALLAYEGDQGTYALILSKLADNYRAQGRLKKSLEVQRRSYRGLSHIGDRHGQARSLHSLGTVSAMLKDYSQANRNFSDAEKLAAQLDDKKMYSDILVSHASCAFRQGRMSEAAGLVGSSIKVKRKIKDNNGLVMALHLKGRILVRQNKDLQALEVYREAVILLEKLVGGMGSVTRQSRFSYLGQFTDLYREYIELLLKFSSTGGEEKGYDREAFLAVERVRSRIFSEMISEARASRVLAANTNDGKFARLLIRERESLLKIQSANRVRSRLLHMEESRQVKEKLDAVDIQLVEAEKEYRLILNELSEKYPRYMDLKKPMPLKISDVQALLGPEELILSYFVTPQYMGIWAIDQKNARLAVTEVGRQALAGATLAMREMAGAVSRLFSRLADNTGREQIEQAFDSYDPDAAHRLFNKLVGQHQSSLQNKKTLYIVPDDVLYKVPFEALLTEKFVPEKNVIVGGALKDAPFLIKKIDVVYLPSISVFRSLRELAKNRPGRQKPLIAFADPVFTALSREDNNMTRSRNRLVGRLGRSGAIAGDFLPQLPETREEALFVAKLLNASRSDVYLGVQASESRVKKTNLDSFSRVLFATHGFLAGEFKAGVQPSLALSFVGDPENDGLLELDEVLGLNLNADLVVLSACNTAGGTGKNDQGEGFAGLTRSFMYAGARSLFVTLWSVESSTAKTLMQSTFNRIGFLGKSGALASAKRLMISAPVELQLRDNLAVSTAHPFFWAPYILVGESHDL